MLPFSQEGPCENLRATPDLFVVALVIERES